MQATIRPFELKKKYDLVFSLGFIEHFSDPVPLLDKMLSGLNATGTLVVGLPNLTCLNGILCRAMDKHGGMNILPTHNLEIMNLNFFRHFAEQNGLNTLYLGYVGGFEPDYYDYSKMPDWFKLVMYPLIAGTRVPLLNQVNSRLHSSYILGIFGLGEGFQI